MNPLQYRIPTGEAQDKLQALHACQPLPRDIFTEDRKDFTVLFRSHKQGGNVVVLLNSKPREATGHKIIVFQVDVVDGKEQLGKQVAVAPSLDRAIVIAAT